MRGAWPSSGEVKTRASRTSQLPLYTSAAELAREPWFLSCLGIVVQPPAPVNNIGIFKGIYQPSRSVTYPSWSTHCPLPFHCPSCMLLACETAVVTYPNLEPCQRCNQMGRVHRVGGSHTGLPTKKDNHGELLSSPCISIM